MGTRYQKFRSSILENINKYDVDVDEESALMNVIGSDLERNRIWNKSLKKRELEYNGNMWDNCNKISYDASKLLG